MSTWPHEILGAVVSCVSTGLSAFPRIWGTVFPFRALFYNARRRSLSLSALNTFLERAESELTMSCRESDSHMTEASRCGPHTASSECRCAYAPPSPFPNSPASRGQTIPADRCGPSMPSPSNVMRAHQQQPARWHACPSNGMHACVPANSPSARITSGLTSSPHPLPTRLSTRLPYR